MTLYQDIYFMEHALKLAKSNLGPSYPNPAVGCVVVKDNQIIASAVTAKNGRPHAEAIAFKELSESSTKDAIVYLTLEPCCHYGLTPPCVDILIKAQIKKIFIAMIDPDPRVNGKSIQILREAGIEVILGVGEKEAKKLNHGFIKLKTMGLPMITLKLATSLDGKISLNNGLSKWISGEKAREFAHLLRAEHNAILVGMNTVLKDDPLLTCRIKGLESSSPIRVILDKNLSIPLNSKLVNSVDQAPLWLITSANHDPLNAIKLKEYGIKIITIDWGEESYLINALKSLAENDIARLLVEGGAATATKLLKNDLIDQLIWVSSNKIIGNDGLSSIANLELKSLEPSLFKLDEVFALEDDVVKIYSNY